MGCKRLPAIGFFVQASPETWRSGVAGALSELRSHEKVLQPLQPATGVWRVGTRWREWLLRRVQLTAQMIHRHHELAVDEFVATR
jgi:hypothetical protein